MYLVLVISKFYSSKEGWHQTKHCISSIHRLVAYSLFSPTKFFWKCRIDIISSDFQSSMHNLKILWWKFSCIMFLVSGIMFTTCTVSYSFHLPFIKHVDLIRRRRWWWCWKENIVFFIPYCFSAIFKKESSNTRFFFCNAFYPLLISFWFDLYSCIIILIPCAKSYPNL